MTKFSRREDVGFKRVSNQLWLWLSQVKKEHAKATHQELVFGFDDLVVDDADSSRPLHPDQRLLEYNTENSPSMHQELLQEQN